MMHQSTKHGADRKLRSRLQRRGNTIVLVSALLVLLVIIAASFVSRTQGNRTSFNAGNKAAKSEDLNQSIARDISQEIAWNLFAWGVDTGDPLYVPTAAPHANNLRVPPPADQLRYMRDRTDLRNNATGVPGADGIPDFPYNRPSFATVPYTNWPDPVVPQHIRLLPPGPGNPGDPTGPPALIPGSAAAILSLEGNELGNPGYGDNRFLADTEPQRFLMANGVERFTHWRHMTNIARANNGWRVVGNIADVGNSIVGDLSLPIEQWLTTPGAWTGVSTNQPDSVFPHTSPGSLTFPVGSLQPFHRQWQDWFGFKTPSDPLSDYLGIYANVPSIPPNLYRLKDLNGNGVMLEMGERPQDAFIPGTARHAVESVLADVDGDGFTDAFWNLAPTPVENGIRHLVAMRVMDNGGMINANVATRFIRNNANFVANISKTISATPADIALVGQNFDAWAPPPNEHTWNVGFFDNGMNRENWMPFLPPGAYGTTFMAWEPNRWADFRNEIGVFNNLNYPNQLTTQDERRAYWLNKGLHTLEPDPLSGLSSFGLADEIELRMYHGQNYPWVFSRFERAVNTNNDLGAFLRSTTGREESSEYLDQLTNAELLRDHRRNLTLYNGSRNDIMPPWLWRFPNISERKLDLRGNMGSPSNLAGALRDRVLKYENGVIRQSYFGTSGVDAALVDDLADAFAANLFAYRDEDDLLNNTVNGFRGMEKQPFIVEAFIGHIYKAFKVPATDFEGDPFNNAGEFVVFEDPRAGSPGFAENRGTVIVVQIANPYDSPIDLTGYTLRVFGQSHTLSGTLDPGTPDHPVTAIYYNITPTINPPWDTSDSLEDKWKDFLDLAVADHPSDLVKGTTIIDQAPGWNVHDRTDYDTMTSRAIELARNGIIIDRIDTPTSSPPSGASTASESFLEAVNDLDGTRPVTVFDPLLVDADPILSPDFPGHPLGGAGANMYWVQWARATRAWGVDVNNDGVYNRHEWNPRFIYADKAVVESANNFSTDSSHVAGGNKYDHAATADTWFDYQYMPADNVIQSRKPTFFDMGLSGGAPVSGIADYPDKGWYGQTDTGTGDHSNVTGATRDVNGSLSRMAYSLQMLQKDRDFDQVGEVLNLWLFGHKRTSALTDTTFSEYLSRDWEMRLGRDKFVNRLRLAPTDIDGDGAADVGFTIGGMAYDTSITDPIAYLGDERHASPALPAGARVLGLFVCDDQGISPTAVATDVYRNADGFSGRATPGLINLNTAPIEVLRALPHLYRLTHEEADTGVWPLNQNPYVRVAESITRYRERYGAPLNLNDVAAAYGDRGLQGQFIDAFTLAAGFGADHNNMHRDNSRVGLERVRSGRGFATFAEVGLLTRSGKLNKLVQPDPISGNDTTVYDGGLGLQAAPFPISLYGENNDVFNSSWRIDMASQPERNGFERETGVLSSFLFNVDHVMDDLDRFNAAVLSTDVVNVPNPNLVPSPAFLPDKVAEDAEEANLLFSGISNLVTTNSDVFTVYFKVRSFRQNPVSGVWDATDPEQIVSEARYVMLVDRSQVDSPSDQPKILYLEKLPN